MDLTFIFRGHDGQLGRWRQVIDDYTALLQADFWSRERFVGERDRLSRDLAEIHRLAGSLDSDTDEVDDIPVIRRCGAVGPNPLAGGQVTVRACIVDDTVSALTSTFRALVGWPGVTLSAWLFVPFAGESSEAAYLRSVAAVLDERPDILVMDQQMTPIAGDVLIRRLQAASDRELLFVGNSAAWPEPLNVAGAVGNLWKGQKTAAFAEVVSIFRDRQSI